MRKSLFLRLSSFRQLSAAYGEVYFKAWRQSGGAFREKVEESCLQDLMYHGALANRSLKSDIFPPILTILEKFHAAKNDRQCQATMCHLWAPILWRNLKVANPMVRANAAELFFSAFPVEDPEGDLLEAREAEMERQFRLMEALLTDDSPGVRGVAITGVCKVLAKFWLIVPSDVLNKFMGVMVRSLAFDASSPKVRFTVIRGLRDLIKNCARSHFYMKQVLPRVSDCLHDVNESVRAAMLDLLAEVKSIKSIKYWDICPLDDLLARLEVDKPVARQKIVKLLMNSFFPTDKEEDTKVERCIYLIKENRQASRKFYEQCEKQLDLHDCVKFFLAVLVHIRRFVKSRQQTAAGYGDSSDTSIGDSSDLEDSNLPVPQLDGSDKENSGCSASSKSSEVDKRGPKKRRLYNDNSELLEGDSSKSSSRNQTLTNSNLSNISERSNSTQHSTGTQERNQTRFAADLENAHVISGLLDVVCIFWVFRSKELSLKENAEYKSLVEKKSVKILTQLFKHYKSTEVIGPVVYLCSLLPHSALSTVAGFCLSRLKTVTLPEPALPSEDPYQFDLAKMAPVSTYTDALCNWGRGDDLFEMIGGWLKQDQQAMSDASPNSVAGGKQRPRRSKGVRFAPEPESAEPRPRVALVLLQYILKHRLNRPMMLKRNRQQMIDVKDVLREYSQVGERSLSTPESVSSRDAKKLICAWEVYLKLNVLLHDGDGGQQDLAATLAVMEDNVAWVESKVVDKGFRGEVAVGYARSLLRICCNMVTMGLCDVNFVGHVVNLCGKVISSGESPYKAFNERLLKWLLISFTDSCSSVLTLSALLISEVAEWAEGKMAAGDATSEADLPVVYSTAIPDLLGRLLSGLTAAHNRNDEAEKLTLEKELRTIRPMIVSTFEAYRNKFGKADPDSYYHVVEIYLASIVSAISHTVSKVRQLHLFL